MKKGLINNQMSDTSRPLEIADRCVDILAEKGLLFSPQFMTDRPVESPL